MKCPKCQFENRTGAKFCSECGQKFEITCPECRTTNRSESKFCDECGCNLGKLKEAPFIDHSKPQSYTPKFLVEKILTTRGSIEGERKLVTVLFADVASYTAMAEKLDPEEVHQIMDGCFKILMREIHKYEGTINQFTGDGIMAIFGAPVAHEDHAQRACYASLAIQEALSDYAERLNKEDRIGFKMRFGLNSGPVVVGSIGDDLRMDYTAIGDTTNLAARMEREARPGSILVSKNLYTITKDFFEFEPVGQLKIKGKEKPQEAYELIKAGKEKTRFKASAARGLTKFVGRKNSMPALKEPYDRVLAGSGQIVGIVGEAGVGKSRLLMELINQLPKAAYSYLEGRCLCYGESIIYMPILEMLKSYFEIKEKDKNSIINSKIKEKIETLDEKLVSGIPPIQALLTQEAEDESYSALDPRRKREKTFESLRDLFITESQNRPLMLVIEDVHWIDKSSEEFLDYLIGWIAKTRIMIVILYRPEYGHPWGSKSYYTKIGLTQLRTASSTQMVQALLEDGQVATELQQLILAKSGGNPLFMEEFTSCLFESGAIIKKGRQFVLTAKASDIQVPDTIQGVIAARMDMLDDSLKRTMQVASVIGREFTFRILHAIAGFREEIKSYLLNLQGLEFIYEKSLFPELEYIFKHTLAQEVAYNSLLKRRRKEIHRKIGEAIEELYAERLEELYEILAYHYSRSGELQKAYQYLKLSGKKATKNFSNWEAFRYYKQAIKLLRKIPETEEKKREKIKVINSMFTSMTQLGFPEGSIHILHEGEKIVKELGDERNLASFYAIIGTYYTYQGDYYQGIKYSEKSFQAAKKIQDVKLMVSNAQSLCASYLMAGENQKLVDLAPSVIEVLEKTEKKSEFFSGGFNSYSMICGQLGISYAFLGNFKEAEAIGKRCLNFTIKINHLPSLGWIETACGYFFAIKGEGKNAIQYFENSIRHLNEGQVVSLLGLPWCGLGWGYHLLGENLAARKHVEKGLDIQFGTGIPIYLSLIHLILGMIHFDLGDLNNAQTYAQRALEFAQQNNEKYFEAASLIWLGRILKKANPSRIDKAKECIFEGITICDDLRIKPFYSMGHLFLGELYSGADQREKAVESLNKAEGIFQEIGMGYWLTKTQEVLDCL
jgi:predicted ATPase/class 3 adenylate cyclase